MLFEVHAVSVFRFSFPASEALATGCQHSTLVSGPALHQRTRKETWNR